MSDDLEQVGDLLGPAFGASGQSRTEAELKGMLAGIAGMGIFVLVWEVLRS